MTDKTPEEQAELHFREQDPCDCIDCLMARKEKITGFVAGYQAASAEFLDEHYAIFYVDGVRYKVEKRGIVHSISNIQRIETEEP